MVISHNSQLGLRFEDKNVQTSFLKKLMDVNKDLADGYKTICDLLDKSDNPVVDGKITIDIPEELKSYVGDDVIEKHTDERIVRDKVSSIMGDKVLIDENGSSFYFICDSVYKAAELIKIGENFTGRTIKDIKFGKYTYLMGKHQMVRFIVSVGAIKGFYYNDKENIAFEWGIEMEEGGYYYDFYYDKHFSLVMQILTFVELGDIEILELKGGRNNGGKKDVDKITNTTKNTVYVVDSTWNKIIIRTDGFAVRGHFRLQPCGKNMADRTLIWISAFEKHGYKRLPKASIAR